MASSRRWHFPADGIFPPMASSRRWHFPADGIFPHPKSGIVQPAP